MAERRKNPLFWRPDFSAALRRGICRPHFSLSQRKVAAAGGKEMFLIWVLAWRTIGRAKASLRSRPLGRWARKMAVLSAARTPNTAPIAARPVQRPPSETDASSSANLRQQGVAESLLVLGGTLVATAHNIYQTRAARYKSPTPSKSPANSTPAFAGRWDRKRPISPAEIFSSTVHGAFFLIFQKEWGVHSCAETAHFCGW